MWACASACIILLSIYFTFYLKFVQFRTKEYKKCFQTKCKEKVGISPLKTLLLTLAGKIGVGSIAGIALAIYVGGVGTIFWVWVISILSLPLAYAETVLGSIYKKKYMGEFVGGPSYYLKFGLGSVGLSKIYAILIIMSFTFGFLGIQVNTISKVVITIFPISKKIIGFILMVLTFFIIVGDVFKISEITSKMVPFMLLFYIGLCIFVLCTHFFQIPSMIFHIFKSAFSLKPFFSGFLYSMIIGIQRGIFSSETGLGTGSITASASNSLNPKKDGYIQMLGVSITTLVVCTITAFMIMLSPYQQLSLQDINGIEIASFAFQYHFSSLGIFLMSIFIFLCAFSTILTGYYTSLVSFRFLFQKHYKIQKGILILFTLIMIYIGSFIASNYMWQIVDFFVAILIFINLYALFQLREKVKNVTENSE
jgi:AGCS family alanine or glycine:cation symporter